MLDEEDFWIILSTTNVSLWKNRIPDFLYKRIKNKGLIQINKDVEHIDRHDDGLIESFAFFYGDHLGRCSYAKLVRLPLIFKQFYSIVQIPVYGNALTTELIEINSINSRIFNENTNAYDIVCKIIYESTHTCKYSNVFKGNIWIENDTK